MVGCYPFTKCEVDGLLEQEMERATEDLLTMKIVLDKYADLTKATRREWARSTLLYASFFMSLVAFGTYQCGFSTLVRLLTVPALAVVHGRPLIPYWSLGRQSLQFVKLKDLLGAGKPLFGATLIGLMDTQAIMSYVTITPTGSTSLLNHHHDDQLDIRANQKLLALAYTILYVFLWENTADARDHDEDSANRVTTLATSLGPKRTMLTVGLVTNIGDILITALGNGRSDTWAIVESATRSILFSLFFTYIALNKPRDNTFWWGLGTIVGLVPAFLAQSGIV